jgi:hypothetical protein
MESQGQTEAKTEPKTEAKTEPKYHVLLIGIDDYPIRPLAGCVNDIDAVQRVLLDSGLGITAGSIRRLASPLPEAKPDTTVPGEAATFARIRDALDRLASDEVRPGDRVFIYYSGHGKRVPVKGRNGQTFEREALVPVDFTRDDGETCNWLFDYEINQRLRAITEHTRAVTVVLDCCHANGALREFDHDDDTARTLDIALTPVPDPALDRAPSSADRGGLDDDAAWLARGLDACQVVSACLAHEAAKESSRQGSRRHGLLTSAFLAALRPIAIADRAKLTWARIWHVMRAEVMRGNPLQTPRMEGGAGRLVFSGPPVDGDAGIPVTRDGSVYRLAAGALSEVDQGAELAIYGPDPAWFPPLASDADRAARLGLVCVTSAGTGEAVADAVGVGFELPPGARARLIKPARKLRVAVDPPNSDIARRVADSPLIELVEATGPDDKTLPRLERHDSRWLFIDDRHGNGTDAPVLFSLADDELPYVRAALEHYYAYSLPMRMADRAAQDLRDGLELKLLACRDGADLTAEEAQIGKLDEVPMENGMYAVAAGARVCVYVRNRSPLRLKVAVFDAASEGEVQLLEDVMIEPEEYHVLWAQKILGKPYTMPLPDGVTCARDRLVAIGRSSPAYELDYLRVDQTFADVVNRGDQQIDDAAERRMDDGTRAAATERWTAVQAVMEIKRR